MPRPVVAVSGENLAMNENEHELEVLEEQVPAPEGQPHEIEVLKERVHDLERQLAQEEASHLTEVEILKHELMRANLKARLRFQDEIAASSTANRAAQSED